MSQRHGKVRLILIEVHLLTFVLCKQSTFHEQLNNNKVYIGTINCYNTLQLYEQRYRENTNTNNK